MMPRRLGGKRVIRRRFDVSVPRARVPETASALRERSERWSLVQEPAETSGKAAESGASGNVSPVSRPGWNRALATGDVVALLGTIDHGLTRAGVAQARGLADEIAAARGSAVAGSLEPGREKGAKSPTSKGS